MTNVLILSVYGVPGLVILGVYLWRRRRRERGHFEVLEQSRAAGYTEPISLHPVVDPLRCVGSASCSSVCPEQAIGVVNGLAQLINPGACIGHGACAAACPFDAIQLVFGTEKRGVDIPQVGPDFQTNVPGVFVAGELGGMGLIHKAALQGERAIAQLAARRASASALDVVIVGAGPAGLAAALAATERGLRYVVLEQEENLGGSILHYPRRKVAMTSPMTLPLVGKVAWREIAKEALVEFWAGVLRAQRLKIQFREAMSAIERDGEGYVVSTSRSRYRARNMLLCLGRRGTPRKLKVPGEDLPKVVYRLIDPHQYRGRKVLVVGGGDSAIEAAVSIAEEAGAKVALSYRGAAFERVNPRNRQRLQAAQGVLQLLSSTVLSISAREVNLEDRGAKVRLPNDDVIVCAGGELPTAMLKSIGIHIETHRGTAPLALAK